VLVLTVPDTIGIEATLERQICWHNGHLEFLQRLRDNQRVHRAGGRWLLGIASDDIMLVI
jgi:hypothetical protein